MGRRGTSSVSTLQVTGAVVMLLVIAILLALVLAPQKPIAPPNSVVTYEDRPRQERPAPGVAAPLPEASPPVAPPQPDADVPAEAAPAAEPVPDEADYTVLGTVTDEDTGEPVAGVEVKVRRVWAPAEEAEHRLKEQAVRSGEAGSVPEQMEALRLAEANLRFETSGLSDQEGRFTLAAPLEGRYLLSARKAGYVPTEAGAVSVSDTAREATLNVRLSTGAAISGRVTEAGTSRGAPEIPVQAGTVRGADVERMSSGTAVTDADGYYVIAGLAEGEHEVSLDLSDVAYEAGKVLPYRRVKVATAKQKVRNIDFTVDPAGVVWGYVTTPDDEPVRSDILVCTNESLVTQFVQAAIKQRPPVNGNSRSEDGYYELIGVPLNKEWNVYVTSNQYPPQLSDPFILTPSQRTVRIDVFMFAGTNIYGYVTDTKGNPVQGAQVVCVPTIGKLLAPMENPHAFREDSTEEDGSFVITQVPAGNYQLFTVKQGYKYSAMGHPVFPDGYNDIDGVHLVLQSVDEGEHQVFGTVVDASGAGLAGVNLSLEGLSTESFNTTDQNTTTDGGGQFVFDGVELGVYQLTASAEGYAPQRVTRVLLDRENTVTLSPGAVIRGRVLIRETNRPPEYYTVRAVPVTEQGTLSSMIFTDGLDTRSGSFNYPDGSFELGVASGYYRLEARAGSLTPGRQEISVEPGDVIEDIVLYVSESGGEIGGRVRVADGSSPQGAQVYITEAGTSAQEVIQLAFSADNQALRQVVGEDGVFLFEHKPAGVYNIIAQHPSYAAAESGPVELAEGGRVTGIELVLGTGGGLEGYVFRDGVPVPGAMVVVMAKGQPRTASADGNGWYTIDEIPPGLVQAVVMPTGMTDVSSLMGLGNMAGVQSVAIEVEAGRTTRYDFGAMTGTRLVGRCSPAPVNPLVGGAVVLRRPGAPLVPQCGTVEVLQISDGVTAAMDGQGNFTIEDVPPGNWQVDVYYAGPGMNFLQLVYRNSALVEVTGAEEGGEVLLDIEAPPCG